MMTRSDKFGFLIKEVNGSYCQCKKYIKKLKIDWSNGDVYALLKAEKSKI